MYTKIAVILVSFLALLSLACTPEQTLADAALADAHIADAGVQDQTQSDSHAADTFVPQDAGGTDSSVVDSGHIVDANQADTAQADAGSCEPLQFNDCVGVAASGHSYTLSTTTRSLSGTHSASLGDTFATVHSAMSSEPVVDASFNAFAKIYCAEGLIFYFADVLGDVNADGGIDASVGVLSDDDVLYKITAFDNFAGSTDSSPALNIGSPLADVETALPAPDVSGAVMTIEGGDGQLRYHNSGDVVILQNQSLSSISVFAPQQAGSFAANLDFAGGQIGGANVSNTEFLGLPVPSGSSISQIKTAIGPNPEALGDLNLNVSGSDAAFFVVSYSVLGLRFSAYASQTSSFTGDNRKAMTAIISPPFQGQDNNGLGIGSSRSDIEAVFGSSYANSVSDSGAVMYKYTTGSRKTGVVYAQDSSCAERAVMFVVNLID